MFEKVNPSHPDKVADRIAGAIVDLAYTHMFNPTIAVEVLIGHEKCDIIVETSDEELYGGSGYQSITDIVKRIAGIDIVRLQIVNQDRNLHDIQLSKFRCADNGIFLGMPITKEEYKLSNIAKTIYNETPSDGKYILAKGKLIICQSNINSTEKRDYYKTKFASVLHNRELIINPIGDWTGGLNVDTGATNRKLGSDMGRSITGGGLHGKDLSKADVSVNIYAWRKAQATGAPVRLTCAIGDDTIDGRPYSEIVDIARKYIQNIGGFEKFAEWGLI